jgi:hypothetical protein
VTGGDEPAPKAPKSYQVVSEDRYEAYRRTGILPPPDAPPSDEPAKPADPAASSNVAASSAVAAAPESAASSAAASSAAAAPSDSALPSDSAAPAEPAESAMIDADDAGKAGSSARSSDER